MEAIEIENPLKGNVFKVNGQWLKTYHDRFIQNMNSIQLIEPVYMP